MKKENKSPSFSHVSHNEDWNTPGNIKTAPFENQINAEPTDNPSHVFGNCLIDVSGRQAACIEGGCLKLPVCFKNDLLQEKPTFQKLRFHPEDRKLWCDVVFPDILRFIESDRLDQFPDYRFIFNHRYIRKDGGASQFMHEGSLIYTNDSRMPLFNLKVFFEIADIKPDETMTVTIFRYFADDGYRNIYTKTYSNSQISKLTPRELEIITLCQKGLSGKMIAEKLNLSIHTIKNHKRNCMEKTKTHNISELIHVCIQNHWL